MASASSSSKGINVRVVDCRYDVVRKAADVMEWDTEEEDEPQGTAPTWTLNWQDIGVSSNQVMAMKPWQRVNHWPGMVCIHRKDSLAATLRRMAAAFRDHFAFHPETFTLPAQWGDFVRAFEDAPGSNRSRKTWIIKPAASCQGRGIYLTRSLLEVTPREAAVAQRYIARPLLIDGLKFDLRVYILVTSVDPLRVWLYDEGLVRFATTPYAPPGSSAQAMRESTMFLTNYAVNKHSANYQFNAGGTGAGHTGSKRTLSWFRGWLDRAYGSGTSGAVWGRLQDTIAKLLIAAQPHLAASYRSVVSDKADCMRCFEVLGLDILLDSTLQTYLLEVNHSPDFKTDTPLDEQVKLGLITETMRLLRLRKSDKRKAAAAAAAAARQRLYSGAASSGSGSGSGGGSGATASAAVTPTAATADGDADASAPATPSSAAAATSDGSGVPAHVRATAPALQWCAQRITAPHAQHEIAVAAGYRLVFPLPHPALVPDAVFTRNAAAAATLEAAAERLRVETAAAIAAGRAARAAAASSSSGSSGSSAAAAVSAPTATVLPQASGAAAEPAAAQQSEEEAEAEADDEGSSSNTSKAPTTTTTTGTGTAAAAATTVAAAAPPVVPAATVIPADIPLYPDSGVPRPFACPADTSRHALQQRAELYRALMAAAEELYRTHSTAAAVGGKRAGDAAIQSSATAIAEAVAVLRQRMQARQQQRTQEDQAATATTTTTTMTIQLPLRVDTGSENGTPADVAAEGGSVTGSGSGATTPATATPATATPAEDDAAAAAAAKLGFAALLRSMVRDASTKNSDKSGGSNSSGGKPPRPVSACTRASERAAAVARLTGSSGMTAAAAAKRVSRAPAAAAPAAPAADTADNTTGTGTQTPTTASSAAVAPAAVQDLLSGVAEQLSVAAAAAAAELGAAGGASSSSRRRAGHGSGRGSISVSLSADSTPLRSAIAASPITLEPAALLPAPYPSSGSGSGSYAGPFASSSRPPLPLPNKAAIRRALSMGMQQLQQMQADGGGSAAVVPRGRSLSNSSGGGGGGGGGSRGGSRAGSRAGREASSDAENMGTAFLTATRPPAPSFGDSSGSSGLGRSSSSSTSSGSGKQQAAAAAQRQKRPPPFSWAQGQSNSAGSSGSSHVTFW